MSGWTDWAKWLLWDRWARSQGGGGLTYLLRDEFTTPDAAPLTSPRTCEPGPGVLTIVDTGNNLDVVGGKLVYSGFTGNGDPGWYWLHGVADLTGHGFYVKYAQGDTGRHTFGFDNTADTSPDRISFYFVNTVVDVYDSVVINPSFPWDKSETAFWIILAATKHFYVAGGTLVWVGSTQSHSGLDYLAAGVYTSCTSQFEDDATLIDLTNTANANPAGVDWSDDYGPATARNATPGEGDTIEHTADCLLDFTVTTLPTGANLLSNGDMEDVTGNNFANWTELPYGGAIYDEGTLVHGGSHAVHFNYPSGATPMIYQNKSGAGGVLAVDCWGRGDGTAVARVSLKDLTENRWPFANVDITSAASYTELVQYGFVEDAANTAQVVFLGKANVYGDFYVDDVTLSEHATVMFRGQDSLNGWVVSVDSTGKIWLWECVAGALTARITGSASDVSNGDVVRVIADDDDISLFVGATKIGSTYASATNFKTETTATVVSEGGGNITNLIAWPRDVSALLPAEV